VMIKKLDGRLVCAPDSVTADLCDQMKRLKLKDVGPDAKVRFEGVMTVVEKEPGTGPASSPVGSTSLPAPVTPPSHVSATGPRTRSAAVGAPPERREASTGQESTRSRPKKRKRSSKK